jgi:hypothetical protein
MSACVPLLITGAGASLKNMLRCMLLCSAIIVDVSVLSVRHAGEHDD